MGHELKGILIGGPGMTKEDFINGNYLNNELKKKIIAVRDLSYTGEFGLHELVDKSQDALAEEEVVKEKKVVQEFFTLLATNSDKVVYGLADVRKALEYGAVDKLLLSEDFQGVDELEDLAESMKTNIFIISTETKEGAQLRDIGGAAAILRYSIQGFN
jgi:peptide subunit release factor 1 (eRF1)